MHKSQLKRKVQLLSPEYLSTTVINKRPLCRALEVPGLKDPTYKLVKAEVLLY